MSARIHNAHTHARDCRSSSKQILEAAATGKNLAFLRKHHYNSKIMTSHADPIVLSFHESCLRASDVSLLQGPHWLNDQLISFYYEYLERKKYHNNQDMLFIAPEVTQCMKMLGDEELQQLLLSLDANKKPFHFYVLNDNETTKAGGMHWSLLVFSRAEKQFLHFDSISNNNADVAKQFVQNIKPFLNAKQHQLRERRALQQTNSYDCGIHVLCQTDIVADYINRYEMVDGVDLVHHDMVSAKRMELLKLIHTLGGKDV